MLRVLYLLTFASLFLFQTSFAQEVEEAISFAFVHKSNGDNGKVWQLDMPDYKYQYKFQTANAVFEKLIEAQGNYQMRTPQLAMSEAKRRVAYAQPSKAQIVLEEKAYDLCASFGADSLNVLAALLAHELVHYYEKHDWTYRMVKDFKDLETGEQLKANNERLKFEAQADLMGGFLAYSAGYQTLGLMPEFLAKVYESYGLKENIKGYPSLTERKEFANRSLDKLSDLVQVFDAANAFAAIGEYDKAKRSLEYILQHFQSRELYNNLGVVATLAAMEFFEAKDLKFAYPIELDATTRLQNTSRGTMSDDKIRIRELLLKQALNYFDQATALDSNYPNTLLNKACVLAMQNNLEDATYFTSKAARLYLKTDTASLSKVLILKGIIAYKDQQIETARNSFHQAHHPLADLNLQVLNQKIIKIRSNLTDTIVQENIDGRSLDEARNELLMGEAVFDNSISLGNKTSLFFQPLDHSKMILYIEIEQGKTALLHLTSSNYQQVTKKGIALGEEGKNVEKTYGTPSKRIQTSLGEYWVYTKRQLLFRFNAESRLVQLGTFRLSE